MTGGPVDEFLAELGRHLGRDAAARERVVAEMGDHLRDLVAEGRARGLDELAAEQEAVDRFGSPRELARSLRPPRRAARPLGAAAALLAVAACGSLAFAALRTTTPPRVAPNSATTARGEQLATVGYQPGRTSLACGGAHFVATIAVQGAHQALIGTRVEIDPRTGRIVACHRLYKGAAGIWVVNGWDNTGGPFG